MNNNDNRNSETGTTIIHDTRNNRDLIKTSNGFIPRDKVGFRLKEIEKNIFGSIDGTIYRRESNGTMKVIVTKKQARKYLKDKKRSELGKQ